MLKQATPHEFREYVDTIPEHPKRIREDRKIGAVFYTACYVYTKEGNLAAMHDEAGRYWISANHNPIQGDEG